MSIYISIALYKNKLDKQGVLWHGSGAVQTFPGAHNAEQSSLSFPPNIYEREVRGRGSLSLFTAGARQDGSIRKNDIDIDAKTKHGRNASPPLGDCHEMLS